MFTENPKSAARQRIISIMYAIFNIDAEMEWDEIQNALIAVATTNECFPRNFELMDEVLTENAQDWDDAFDKTMNNVAMGKSFDKFATHIVKFFDFSNPK